MIFAEVVATDPNVIGFAVTSLVGSLSAAGAAVAVTYYFLAFLRDHAEKLDRWIAEDRKARCQFANAMRDALADQRRSFRDELRHQLEMTDAMGRDCLMATKALTERLDDPQATAPTPDLSQALGGLQASINGIDVLVRRMVEVGVDAKRDPRAKPTAREMTGPVEKYL